MAHATRQARLSHLATTSLLAAVAFALAYLETMMPLPATIPGVKLGLANVTVAVALLATDARTAFAVATVKVLATGLLFGSPATLLYSLGGTLLSMVGMLTCARLARLGPVPTCMAGAILHNAGQLCVAALMLRTSSVFVSLPALAVAGCVTGALSGAVTEATLASLAGLSQEEARPHVEGQIELRPGERVAFVGANGSGKTSFALQLVRELGGGNGGRAGMVLQDADAQIVASVVRDDVAFGLENAGVERGEMRRRVATALADAGLADLAGRDVSTLSGGQRQRVATAGVLALAPGMVVFDEATSMLDPAARQAFSAQVARLQARGIAVVQITQHMDEAFEANRVAVFAQGRVTGVYMPDELLERPELLSEAGLELPPVARLAQELRAAGIDVPITARMDELEEAVACCAASI